MKKCGIGFGAAFAALAFVPVLLASACGRQAEESAGETETVTVGRLATEADYRRAVDDARSCLQDKGYEVSPVVVGSAGILLTFSWEAGDGASEAFDACYEDHLKQVEHDWFYSNVPVGSERDVMFDEFVGCLKGIGVNNSQIRSERSLAEVVDLILEQVDDESREFSEALLCIDDFRLLYPEGMFPLE